MYYDNIVQKLKDELNATKNDNMKLQTDIITLKDELRVLNNEKNFLENYNNRLLYIVKTEEWRQSS